jgi:hypothetical protein
MEEGLTAVQVPVPSAENPENGRRLTIQGASLQGDQGLPIASEHSRVGERLALASFLCLLFSWGLEAETKPFTTLSSNLQLGVT